MPGHFFSSLKWPKRPVHMYFVLAFHFGSQIPDSLVQTQALHATNLYHFRYSCWLLFCHNGSILRCSGENSEFQLSEGDKQHFAELLGCCFRHGGLLPGYVFDRYVVISLKLHLCSCSPHSSPVLNNCLAFLQSHQPCPKMSTVGWNLQGKVHLSPLFTYFNW